MIDNELAQWLPVSLIETAEVHLFRWMRFNSESFYEPFFEESFWRNKAVFEENRKYFRSVTAPEMVVKMAGICKEPELLVLHISRCGSTLLSQLLGLDEQITTLAEVPLFDEIMASPDNETDRKQLLRSCASLLRRNSRNLVVKCDSWHFFHYDFLRNCFPETPVVFLYRNPFEVWQSHQKQPGIHTVPGLLKPAQLPGFQHAGEGGMQKDLYFGKIMEAYFHIMLQHASDKNTLLLNYSEGALPLATKAACHAGIKLHENHLRQMEERARFNAKKPHEVFSEKQSDETVPEFLRGAVVLFEELEKERINNTIV